MTDQAGTIQKIKSGLEPYIKPREQVNYIRRVLALHLGTCSSDEPIQHPLGLADSLHDVAIPSVTNGIFREYVEALQANVAARRQLDGALHSHLAASTEPPASNTDLLEERICLVRLRQKQESLLAARQSLDLLIEKPAATQDFLDYKQIFQGTARLPSLPSDFVHGLVVDQGTSRFGLTDRIHQLEKTVLRAKLLLKQEEQTLREARARSKGKHDVVSNWARLEALNATRNELVSWFEAELGKASFEEVEETQGRAQGPGHHSDASPSTIATRLDDINKKYVRYVFVREAILDLCAQQSQPLLPPPVQQTVVGGGDKNTPRVPTDHILTLYLGALIAISGKQKAIIAQKIFTNSTLGKQNQGIRQLLGRLGEESHLLPAYPMKDSLRRRSGIQNEIATKSSEQPDIASRIKPWVFGADSARMATLEYVAEAVECGQLALESFMGALREIDLLLGRSDMNPSEDSSDGGPSEDDMWLAEANEAGTGKRTVKKQSVLGEKYDIWSRVQGDLGLLGEENVV